MNLHGHGVQKIFCFGVGWGACVVSDSQVDVVCLVVATGMFNIVLTNRTHAYSSAGRMSRKHTLMIFFSYAL
jgi:hypothetical protein